MSKRVNKRIHDYWDCTYFLYVEDLLQGCRKDEVESRVSYFEGVLNIITEVFREVMERISSKLSNTFSDLHECLLLTLDLKELVKLKLKETLIELKLALEYLN